MWNKTVNDGLTAFTLKSTQYIYELQSSDDTDKLNKANENYGLYGKYIRKEIPIKDNLQELPSGAYRLCRSGGEYFLASLSLEPTDYILDLQVINKVKEEYIEFVNSKHIFDKMKVPFKQGILLYGPPGTGKTSAINQLIRDPIFSDSIIIFCEEILPLDFRNKLNEDPRLKVIIFEEIVTTLQRHESLARMLDFLDGTASLNKMFVLATTNYPEKLPANIADRPGRMGRTHEIGYLTDQDKKTYYNHITNKKLSNEEVDMLGNITIAQLKEICLFMLCRGLTFREAVFKIKSQQELANSGFKLRDEEDIAGDIY